jgi:DNA polymerase-1
MSQISLMPKTLLLVDGSNQAYRAYFAIQTDMRSPDGFPTRALFGYAGLLHRFRKEIRPDYIAVVFDRGLSFRNALYPDYKGQRPDMPEDLRAQWPEFEPFAEDWGMRAMSIEGEEADDIIGTLAVRFAGPGLKVLIASSDKDFCQLVGPHIRMWDVKESVEIGEEGVKERWGVRPDQIIDLLSLMGDSSDNVPGIAGVGEKKAAKYLETYGSAAGVLDNADKIGGKTGQTIAASRDVVALARLLVTIKTDMELPGVTLESLAPRSPDLPALELRLRRYNFKRMLEAVQAEMAVATPASAEEEPTEVERAPSPIDRSRYRTVTTEEALSQLEAALRQAGRFAYDCETTHLDPQQAGLVGMSFCWGAGQAAYVPIAHEIGPNCAEWARLLTLLADPTLGKTGQNLKYDLSVLRAQGKELAGIVGDTMLADYLIDSDRKHGLDEMARRYLNHEMISYSALTSSTGGSFAKVGVAEATAYAAEDAEAAWLIDQHLELGPLGPLYRDIELPLIGVLADMELAGIGVDVASLGALSVELGQRVKDMEAAVIAEAGETFNVNSTQQLAHILFEKRGLKPLKKTKSGYSTDAQTLERLAEEGDRLCQLILDYRELAKLKSTYVDALPAAVSPVDGRVHSSFHQAVAATGRLSSNDPNLQNIPIRTPEGRRIRACFVPAPGHVFLSADYSQIELRILAHFCGDGPLVEAYTTGQDIHRRTAAEIFGVAPALVSSEQRRAAKAINFGIIYGMGAKRLSAELRIPAKTAQAYIDGYFARYPQVQRYMSQAAQSARDLGYAETLLGRRRPLKAITAGNPVDRAAAERIAINTPVQGTAADIIKMAMLKVHAMLKAEHPQARLLLQVHDELVLEVPVEEAGAVAQRVKECMQGVVQLVVPLEVEVGQGFTWDAAH